MAHFFKAHLIQYCHRLSADGLNQPVTGIDQSCYGEIPVISGKPYPAEMCLHFSLLPVLQKSRKSIYCHARKHKQISLDSYAVFQEKTLYKQHAPTHEKCKGEIKQHPCKQFFSFLKRCCDLQHEQCCDHFYKDPGKQASWQAQGNTVHPCSCRCPAHDPKKSGRFPKGLKDQSQDQKIRHQIM